MDTTRALYVTRNTSTYGMGDAFLHLTARVVTLADDGTPRNIPTGDAYRPDPMAGITLTAQADRTSHSIAGDPPEYSYAWRLGIATDSDPMPIDLIPPVLATLKRARGRMNATEARYGSARTFGAYVARLADALGVPVLTGSAGSDGMYSSGMFATWRPGEVVNVIDGWIAEFRRDGAA